MLFANSHYSICLWKAQSSEVKLEGLGCFCCFYSSDILKGKMLLHGMYLDGLSGLFEFSLCQGGQIDIWQEKN